MSARSGVWEKVSGLLRAPTSDPSVDKKSEQELYRFCGIIERLGGWRKWAPRFVCKFNSTSWLTPPPHRLFASKLERLSNLDKVR